LNRTSHRTLCLWPSSKVAWERNLSSYLLVQGCCTRREATIPASAGDTLAGVTLTVNLPEKLAARLAAEATRRGRTVEDLVTELVAAQLADDPLEAFIGSGASGRGDLGRRHREIRAELTEEPAARDL
jgi:hypothetical protein